MDIRRVHAFNGDKTLELVRYDRAGKWYIEPTEPRLPRQRVTLDEAVEEAACWWSNGGSPVCGVPGGSTFERRLQKRYAPTAAAKDTQP